MDSALNIQEIMQIIPHRFPFLLVDRVLSVEPGKTPGSREGAKIVALKNVTFNEPYFPGHFPGLPVMPGVLQIEAMAQASCMAIVKKGDPPSDFFVASVNNAKFRRPVVPGDSLILKAEIVRDRGSMILVKAEALVADQVVSEAEILAKVAPQKRNV